MSNCQPKFFLNDKCRMDWEKKPTQIVVNRIKIFAWAVAVLRHHRNRKPYGECRCV